MNRDGDLVNDSTPPSTLRELRRHMLRPLPLTLMAVAAVVLSLMGAFGTSETLRTGPRLAYWTLIVLTTYPVGYLCSELFWTRLRDRAPVAVIITLSALATAVGVTLTVIAINAVLFDNWLEDEGTLVGLATVFVIAALVSAAMHLIQVQIARQQAALSPDTSRAPPLLERLPLAKRGALVALSVEDHYVRVRTDKGDEMLLMRLSDAMRETAPTPGLQVHRSHWVATDQVAAVARRGDRAILTMRHGGDIPASRSHIQALKDAGLLPR